MKAALNLKSPWNTNKSIIYMVKSKYLCNLYLGAAVVRSDLLCLCEMSPLSQLYTVHLSVGL